MEKRFVVITRDTTDKEISKWWEHQYQYLYDVKDFSTFSEAKQYMRSQITDILAEYWQDMRGSLFQNEDEPEFEEAEYSDMVSAIASMLLHSFPSARRVVGQLTDKLIKDPDYVPDAGNIETVEDVDDADHYFAYVCNDKMVLAYDGYNGVVRLEYNIHKMDDENSCYYFELFWPGEDMSECVLSVQLMNTEETVDATVSEVEDAVACEQITFGHYPQGADSTEKAPIVWDVLKEEGDKMLVLSHKCLEYRVFNDGQKRANWEKSELRRWLNDEFISEAFNADERKKILLTQVKEKRVKATEDRVFVLSEEEFDLVGRDNRSAFPTEYARRQYSAKLGRPYNEPYAFWWLRTRGVDVKDGYDLVHVCANGSLNGFARSDSSHPNGIRPAMWIKKVQK